MIIYMNSKFYYLFYKNFTKMSRDYFYYSSQQPIKLMNESVSTKNSIQFETLSPPVILENESDEDEEFPLIPLRKQQKSKVHKK